MRSSNMSHIQDGIYITDTAWNNFRNPRILELIVRSMPVIHEIMTIPPDQKIIVSPRKNVNGEFLIGSQNISINSLISDSFEIISTLCHECVHSEQYFTGRLNFSMENSLYKIGYDDLVYEIPLDLIGEKNMPWEREAYSREYDIAEEVISILNRDKSFPRVVIP